MARKGGIRYRTRTVVKRARGGGGKQKAIIDGLIAGAAAAAATRFLNVPMADDIALLGVGYFRNNNTLKTLGGLGLGSDLVAMGLGGQGKTSYGGVY